MDKIKVVLITIMLSLLFVLCGINFIPKFLNFMETQNDILKIRKIDFTSFNKVRQENNISKNFKISYNISIPEDIKEKLKEKEERIKIEQAKKEEEARIQNEIAKKQEQKAKETQTEKKSSSATSRNNEQNRDNKGWVKFVATAYCRM